MSLFSIILILSHLKQQGGIYEIHAYLARAS